MRMYLRALIAALAIFAASVMPAKAEERGPFGVQLVLLNKCQIDFSQIKWIGDHNNPNLLTEKAAMQVAWLVSRLPAECYEKKCLFGNITQDNAYIYDALRIVRFMERLEPEMAQTIAEAMKGCLIERPPYQSLSDGGGSGIVCTTGNSFTLTLSGNGNSVNAGQSGCNVATITINGNNITLTINQVGSNTLVLTLDGDNINAAVSQYGSNVYTGTFTSNTVTTITQNNM
jgi:hypothetical protein